MALSPGAKRRRNEKRDENRRSRLADAGRKNGNDLLSLWKKPRGSDMTASSSANRDTLDHRRRESELDPSVPDAVTSRPVIDVNTDDVEEAPHTAAAAAAAATPAPVLAPASPSYSPGRRGKGKGKGEAPPSTLENREISRDLEESVEPAPPRKKQRRADKAGGGGGGDGLDDFDDDEIRRATQASLRDGSGGGGSSVVRTPLQPHQTALLDRVLAATAHESFASHRAKMGEIARKAAEDKGMGDEASTDDVLREACQEYDLLQVLALDQLRERPLRSDEMEKGGIEVFDRSKDYGGAVNYVHVYEFFCVKATIAMVDKWESEMGVGSALCGSVRAKALRHEWDNGALRLLISGEGLSASAYKYARGLQQPPTADRARQPRILQGKGRVANDGPAWNVPAGLVLVGGDALDRVGTETYVWRTGDPHRSSRELHEMILALVFLGGLVWFPESVGLNQKAGGTFDDEQRARGGRANYSAKQKGRDKSTKELKAEGANSCNITGCSCKGADDCTCVGHVHVSNASAGGAASSGTDNNQVGAGPNENRAAKKRKDIAVDAGDEGAEKTSSTPASKPTKELGLCLGLSSDGVGLVAKLRSSIDLETGAILADPALWCDNPKFVKGKLGQRGLTLRKSKWEEDETGCLVLGYHNTNGRDGKTPACVASTVPVVKVGEKWLVPEWALRYIRAGNVVRRGTNNQRHNGQVEKARVRTKARK